MKAATTIAKGIIGLLVLLALAINFPNIFASM